MHNLSLKGVFYAGVWQRQGSGAILAGLHETWIRSAGISFYY